jgi:hypothetical protein
MIHDIWLGDLALAWATLGEADDVEWQTAAAMLGLRRGQETPLRSARLESPPSNERRAAYTELVESVGDDVAAVVANDESPKMPAPRPVHSSSGRQRSASASWTGLVDRVRRLLGRSASVSTSLERAPLLPSNIPPVATDSVVRQTLPRANLDQLGEPLPFDPLLAPRSASAMIHLMLGQRTADGPLDIAAAVKILAGQRPLAELPRRRRSSLRYGAQILVDRSDTMRIFARDQANMVRRVRWLIGADRSEVLYFTGSPMRGVTRRPADRPERYRPPAPHTRVLLLSDFGVVPHINCRLGAQRAEWESYFRSIESSARTPVGLIPYPSRRWPDWLDRQVSLVTWDRSSTAALVQTRVR